MKYIVISTLAPGTDDARQALEAFMKVGAGPETEATWASVDGKTFINIVESDSPDMTISLTYAPFFDKTVVHPVVAVDGSWLEAVQTAQSNWS